VISGAKVAQKAVEEEPVVEGDVAEEGARDVRKADGGGGGGGDADDCEDARSAPIMQVPHGGFTKV
jgi:hypothetical protein